MKPSAPNQLGWGGKYSPHATRTTGSTRLNEMGFSPDWIERQLAHAEPNVVRRTVNHADYHGRRPFGPTDRYELWIKPHGGVERKFTINPRTMPARRGHEVSLIATAHPVTQVLGVANWTAIDGVNYARADAPPLVRVWDFRARPGRHRVLRPVAGLDAAAPRQSAGCVARCRVLALADGQGMEPAGAGQRLSQTALHRP